MKFLNIHYLKSSGLIAAFVFTLLMPGLSQAIIIVGGVPAGAGYDLFHTVDATFTPPGGQGINFQGVPIGSYNFGGAVGTKNVGNTDTIVKRLDNVNTNGGITGLAIQALQLVSLNYFGAGDNLYVTLATTAPLLTGLNLNGLEPNTMKIEGLTSGTKTFTSYLDFYIDFYRSTNLNFNDLSTGILVNKYINGSNGNNDNPIEKIFSASGNWNTIPAFGELVIPGVNQVIPNLNNEGTLDFYAVGQTLHEANDGTHTVEPSIPEPATLILLTLGLGFLGFSSRKTAISTNMLPA